MVVREAYSAEYEAGWAAYPRKVNKHGCWIQWQRLVRSGESADDMIAACRHLAAEVEREGTEDRFIPHGATFFGPQRKYLDYVAGVPPARRRVGKVNQTLDSILAAGERFGFRQEDE